MDFCDVVNFEFDNYKEYDFSKVFVLGRDILEFEKPKKEAFKTKAPKILKTTNPDLARRYLNFFDIVYLQTYETNIALMRTVAQKKKFFEISLFDIFGKEGIRRAVSMYKLSRFLNFCLSYNARFIITSRAKSVYDIRAPDEIASIFEFLGITKDQAKFALTWLYEGNTKGEV